MDLTSKALHQVPFSRITLAFICGILIRNFFGALPIGISLPLSLLSIFLLLSLIVLNRIVKKRYSVQLIFGGFTLFTLLIFGFQYASFYIEKTTTKIPLTGFYSGIVSDKSMFDSHSAKLSIDIDVSKDQSTYVLEKEQIVMLLNDSISAQCIEPGDRISFFGTLAHVENKGNPGEYNFKRYLEVKGVNKQISLKTAPLIEKGTQFGLRISALRLRSKLLTKFREYKIKGDEYAVLAALTLGDKTDLSSELKRSFSISGAMHVLSVSGLHVGVIFIVLEFILKALNRNRKSKLLKALIIVLSLWGYAFITGLSPSVMRASTMLSFVTIGKNVGKNTNIYNTLFASAFFLLLFEPLILFEVGFQLSYFAVFSIVFFQPKIFQLFTFKSKSVSYLWNMLSVSIAAQIGTTPISFYYFHQFPVYFWASNFVVIPLSAFIIYGAILFFISLPVPFIARIIAYIVSKMTWLMNTSVHGIESLPGSVISGIWISLFAMIVLYISLFNVIQFFKTKQATYLIFMMLCVVVLLAESCLKTYRRSTQQLLIVYNSYPNEGMSLICGRSHYYIHLNSVDSAIITQAIQATSYYGTEQPQVVGNHFITNKNVVRNENLVVVGDKSILIANQLSEAEVCGKLNIDYVFIKKEIWKNDSLDFEKLGSTLLIAKSFNDNFSTNKNVYNLKRRGAFIAKL